MSRIAGIMVVQNYDDHCHAFETLRRISDYTIILDYNSQHIFPYKKECDEYLHLRSTTTRDHSANIVLLMYRAFINDCQWVICMHDDIFFSPNFATREDAAEIIQEMESKRYDTCHFRLRYLWESANQYRCDGEWDRKHFDAIKRNWFFDPLIKLPPPHSPLCEPVFPSNKAESNRLFDNYIAYHAGCISHSKRNSWKGMNPNEGLELSSHHFNHTPGSDSLRLARVPESDRGTLIMWDKD